MDTLKTRRSIRKFKVDEVSDEVLNPLFEKAFRSSTTGNMQLYSVVITRDKAQKEKLAPAHFNQPAYANAPMVITFCADFNRFTKWCEQRNATPGYNNAESFACAAIDTVIAAQTFCVAAEEAGLGICYLGTTTYNPDQIAEVLQLPKLVVPIVTLSVGYPAEDPQCSDRLPISAIVPRGLQGLCTSRHRPYLRRERVFEGEPAIRVGEPERELGTGFHGYSLHQERYGVLLPKVIGFHSKARFLKKDYKNKKNGAES